MKIVEFKRLRQGIYYYPLKEYDNKDNYPKKGICKNTFQDIDLIMNFPAIEKIEDLEEDKDIKDKGEMPRIYLILLIYLHVSTQPEDWPR